ncbi:origin recognition complex subunit 1 [Brachionichthys hirsutus]|uniref:origin recognition complex subunit 1 n=1 Tax=Brachionichthys hirsutus TaxID=412623 RepID=UPI003604AE78
MKYLTRLRVRRKYRWCGDPVSFNRKIRTFEYRSLAIQVEGVRRTTFVTTGQHILIEGDDDDNPFVAKVLRLFGDEGGAQMKAEVQWFVRVSEVPLGKLKLLGREPHPQEIFLYGGRSCEDEVDAQSILRPVEVRHVGGAAPFPPPGGEDVLYVKLSWDSKAFRAVDSAHLGSGAPGPRPSLPPSPPCSPPAAAPGSRPAPGRVLPTPDLAVMRRAASSTGGGGAAEAESLHSTTKLSASRCLSARRRGSTAGAAAVRKKLQLSSPDKTPPMSEDVQLLDEEESGVMLAQRLSLSPPEAPPMTLRKPPSPPGAPLDHVLLKNATVVLDKYPHETNSPVSPARDACCRDGSPPGQIPKQGNATPRRSCATRGQKATTPSRRSEARTRKKPALVPLAEATHEDSPAPRSSKRKTAQLVSSRIRKQLKLLGNELMSDGEEDEDEFRPSKKELQASSEDEEEVGGGAATKRRRRPRRTPNGKVGRRRRLETPEAVPRRLTSSSVPQVGPGTPQQASPSIPSRSLPVRRPANVLEEARTRLHVSAVPESLPCREQEFQDIYSFVESKVTDGTGGCMYISGVPGTGKTATVQEVMRCLQHAAAADDVPPFNFIEINGMKMTDPHQAYVQILQKLAGQKATADHAAALLEKRFSSPAPRKETTVLLVDELDLLWTRKQNVMYNLFDWPTRRHARLVVLTIANTMDLPERIMINRVASRLGLTRMSFQPYSFRQLQQIVTSRLNKVKAFEEDALQLVSRKVAALSGDARRCLDICRRATEICEHAAAGLVGMSHVMEALDEMFSSPYVAAIRCASAQEQLFLRAVIAEFRRLGLEEATFQQVFVQHRALCRLEGLLPVGVSEALGVCHRLGACRVLLLESSRLQILQRVRLNVSQDDVLYALKSD